MLLLLVNTIAAPLTAGGGMGWATRGSLISWSDDLAPLGSVHLSSPTRSRAGPGDAWGTEEQTFECALPGPETGVGEVVGIPAGGLCYLPAGALRTTERNCPPLPGQRKWLLIFHFWGRGLSLAFRGDRSCRPPHHALGSHHAPALPPAPTSRIQCFRRLKVDRRRAGGAASRYWAV